MDSVLSLTPHVGLAQACNTLGVPRATLYRVRPLVGPSSLPPMETTAEPSRKPVSHRALSDTERQNVLAILHQERFQDSAPAAVQAQLLDEGKYLCSTRTMYRLLAAQGESRERRNQLTHPPYQKPELLATGPNQVWSWDITKLRGPVKWTYFYFYVIIDIFSRYVTGWMVAEREAAVLAEHLVSNTLEKHSIPKDQLTIHSDRGRVMRSKPLAFLYADLGVTKSFSRPYVSDDNPFSESHFRTLKYRPDFPDRFGSLQDARAHCRAFIEWYNQQHRHSALGMLPPAVVHFGQSANATAQRQLILDAAYQAHPERFVRRPPRAAVPSNAVWINPPKPPKSEGESH